MTLTVDVLRRWEPAALGGPGAQLRAAAGQVDDLISSLRAVAASLEWEGRAAEAAGVRSQELAGGLRDVADALRLQGDVLHRARRALEAAQALLRDAHALAGEHGLRVLPDGGVTPPHPVLTAADPAPEVLRAIAERQRAAGEAQRRAEAWARESLAAAAECDADAARALTGAHQQGTLLAGLLPGLTGLLLRTLPGVSLGQAVLDEVSGRRPPPEGTDPHRVAAWWASLPADVQADLVRTRPGALGGLDGLPAAVRDTANRARLPQETAALEAALAQLAPGDPAGDRLREQLAAVQAVVDVVGLPDRQLLALDLTGTAANAVVAIGDVDTAAHVAVLTPGFSTTVRGNLRGHDRRLAALRTQAGALAGGGASVATVAWLGYDAPQDREVLRPSRSVAHDAAARRGAQQLSAFFAGVDAARSTPAHLTALGHSYGSLVTGHALRPGTPVDDVVLFGSPGIGTSDVRDLGLPPGRVHVAEASGDVVADLAHFGDDPNQLDGVTGLSTLEAVVDGRRLSGSTGHSGYLDEGSTSQYAIAAVVAGRPELAPRDDGVGLGDWLQTPPPQWLP